MRVGKQSLIFDNVYIQKSSVIVGPREFAGPLGGLFDFHYDNLNCGEKSWEQAEMAMYKKAINTCLNKNDKEIKYEYSFNRKYNIVKVFAIENKTHLPVTNEKTKYPLLEVKFNNKNEIINKREWD